MGRIDIHGGVERDEFYDQNGKLLGVAEYDLNDAGVRLRVLEFADTLTPRWEAFQSKVEAVTGEELADTIAKTRLEVDFVDVLRADADAIFGEGFCEGAIGSGCKNVLTLIEVLDGIITKYGGQPNSQLDRLINSVKARETAHTGNRAQRRGKK